MNVTAVDTAMETAATTSAPKHKWLSKLTRGAKKATMFATIAGVMATTGAMQAFAAGTGEVDTSSFITTACTVLKSVICLIGAGVGVWGVDYVCDGDTLYIESISRLGRSTKDLLNIIDTLTEKGVTLVSHKESIDVRKVYAHRLCCPLTA